jgi:hypothetical protein
VAHFGAGFIVVNIYLMRARVAFRCPNRHSLADNRGRGLDATIREAWIVAGKTSANSAGVPSA